DPRRRPLLRHRSLCPLVRALPISTLFPYTTLFRSSLPLFGDGFVEAVADEDLLKIAKLQRESTGGQIHGQAISVDIAEVKGAKRIGRFGWKDQHASLLSFSSDAYLNEMGVTNQFAPDEVTTVCNPPGIQEPNNVDDIANFTTFMRALKAPPRDETLAKSLDAQIGADLFERIGCQTCHVNTLRTVPAGTKLNGGDY